MFYSIGQIVGKCYFKNDFAVQVLHYFVVSSLKSMDLCYVFFFFLKNLLCKGHRIKGSILERIRSVGVC
mgnify:CR=1 FL=1